MDPMNVHVSAEFEVRGLTHAWDNSDWSLGVGCEPQSWGRGGCRPRSTDGVTIIIGMAGTETKEAVNTPRCLSLLATITRKLKQRCKSQLVGLQQSLGNEW